MEGRARQPRSAEPAFPGATKHGGHAHHPHACSTPRKNDRRPRHFRSSTEPKSVADLQPAKERAGEKNSSDGCGSHEHVNVANEAKSGRRRVRAQRRMNSEPKRKRSRSADARKGQDCCHGDELSKPASTGTASDAPTRYLPHACCSAVTDCYLCPHHHLTHGCYAPPTSQHTAAVPLHIPPAYACPHCAPLWAWPMGGAQAKNIEPAQRCSSAPGVHGRCPTEDDGGQSSGPLPRTVWNKNDGGNSDTSNSSIHRIQALAQEMSTMLQHGLDSVKNWVATNQSE